MNEKPTTDQLRPMTEVQIAQTREFWASRSRGLGAHPTRVEAGAGTHPCPDPA